MKRNNLSVVSNTTKRCGEVAVRCLKACEKFLAQMQRVKEQIIAQVQTGYPAPRQHWVSQTLNEAEALAWQSGFPHLVFPVLAEEKVSNLKQWQQHQNAVHNQLFKLAA
jgi:hypothetical protein